jgi:hypothetical protein
MNVCASPLRVIWELCLKWLKSQASRDLLTLAADLTHLLRAHRLELARDHLGRRRVDRSRLHLRQGQSYAVEIERAEGLEYNQGVPVLWWHVGTPSCIWPWSEPLSGQVVELLRGATGGAEWAGLAIVSLQSPVAAHLVTIEPDAATLKTLDIQQPLGIHYVIACWSTIVQLLRRHERCFEPRRTAIRGRVIGLRPRNPAPAQTGAVVPVVVSLEVLASQSTTHGPGPW